MTRTPEEIQEIARVATREAMAGWQIPDDVWALMTLGIGPMGDGEGFILYVPGERPSDARDISRTIVSREGEVLSVEVYDDVLRRLGATRVE